MYNLTVDEAHTFFVGDGQWLVHNAGVCPFDSVTQLALHRTLGNLDDSAIAAFRYRPPNAIKWEGLYRPKPVDFHLYYGFESSGRRWGQFSDGTFGWVYSDLDVAGVTFNNRRVEGRLFHDEFQIPFNNLYWQLRGGTGNFDLYKVIQHGPLAEADARVWAKLLDNRGMDGVLKMLRDDVYLFDANHYLGPVPYSVYLQYYYP
jgi:hypothetical protein